MSPKLLEQAKSAATKIVGEVRTLRHLRTLPTGEQVFQAACQRTTSRVVVTVNPNGIKAVVEWRSGTKGRNYKVCDLELEKVG